MFQAIVETTRTMLAIERILFLKIKTEIENKDQKCKNSTKRETNARFSSLMIEKQI